jgi:Helix-turn-helix domain
MRRGVLMGRPAGWMTTLTGRPALRSLGRPPVRRDVERAFWSKIVEGLTSEDAAIACGVSGPVGSRWFRERGGMPSIRLGLSSGRYLSFAEREEIALLKARDVGVCEIARRLRRSRRRSRGSCGATPPRGAGGWSIGRRPRSGRRS